MALSKCIGRISPVNKAFQHHIFITTWPMNGQLANNFPGQGKKEAILLPVEKEKQKGSSQPNVVGDSKPSVCRHGNQMQ